MSLALGGVGIFYSSNLFSPPLLDSGELRVVLPDWASMGNGFHIYYSGCRQVPTALRLLIDLIRQINPLGQND